MSSLDKQEGGGHYKNLAIQPVEYIHANGLSFLEGNVVKYITRHKQKNGIEDIKKVIHYCELILQLEYGITKQKLDNETLDVVIELLYEAKDNIAGGADSIRWRMEHDYVAPYLDGIIDELKDLKKGN